MSNPIEFKSLSTVDERIDYILSNNFNTEINRLFTTHQFYQSMGVVYEPPFQHCTADTEPLVRTIDTTIRYMIEDSLLRQGATHPTGILYDLSLPGKRIKERGGWLKHLEQNRNRDELLRHQMESTIAANNLSEKTISSLQESNRIQRNILVFTVLLTLANLVISVLNYKKPNEVYVLPTPLQEQRRRPLLLNNMPVPKCIHGNDTTCCHILGTQFPH